ncbi:hypothetical protein MNV49_005777 [Pseudohyphozyma bogoriensis]|nr:hypothetical protein MNV49_005777 [Pseudohyphozyma bogoriensis]
MSSVTTTWFITGCSVGFGRELVLALLARKHKVVATARRLDSIRDLHRNGAFIYEWDVTEGLECLQRKAKEIDEKVGGVSVVVNNAGFYIDGALEETTPEDDKRIFDTNVFGLMNTTRAWLPHLRARKTGTIINLSSIAGLHGEGALGLYNATKFAVEGLTEALHEEISHLGLNAMVVSPGYFRTNFLASPPPPSGLQIPDYAAISTAMRSALVAVNQNQPGDPVKGVNVIIDVVLGEGKMEGKKEMPVRLPLGRDAFGVLEDVARRAKETVEEWKGIAGDTDCDDVKKE